MLEFRRRHMPIDSFIMDYDWFGPDPCGAAVNSSTPADPDGKQGAYNCGDSGYRDGWWNNQSFPNNITCATAADVFDHFHAPPLSMRFGGIRKPRTYSNVNLARSNGWLLPPASDVGEGGGINFNFSIPELREWYAATHAHFIEDGMDFWWNDEGETAWFTYLLWNEAEAAMFKQRRPNVRHFTINRAHQPGMQRFPAVSWTGDGQSCAHEELLRGMMHGSPLTSCDLTSPDATTLVRQYQSAVFTPIMRVHMMKGTPRFPWFWPANASDPGYAAHQRAFQSALEMRYRFLPFLYSLAHGQHRHGKPIAHPASFAFPDECSAPRSLRCAMAQQTYMVGEVLLPSDLLGLAHTSVRPPPLENASRAVLPVLEGSSSEEGGQAWWFKWNTTTALAGGQTVRENLGLAEMSVFVKAGAILPLQANASQVQHTAQAGGVLELQIYAGADGAFEMVEDDGISYDYATGALEEDNAMVRTTTWRWGNVDKTLTWSVSGGAALKSAHAYTHVVPVLFAKGRKVERAAVVALTADGGRVVFSSPRL
jgi:alpha-glucosidase